MRLFATLVLTIGIAACHADPESKLTAPVTAAAKGINYVQWGIHSLREVNSLSELPIPVLLAIGSGSAAHDPIADRGQPFQATDVIIGDAPRRRFFAAGHDGNYWLVAVENGGIAYNVQVYLFKGDALEHTEYIFPALGPRPLERVVALLPKAMAVAK